MPHHTDIEFLKIQVVRHDGRHETLTLAGPVVLHPSSKGGQGSIATSTGTSHFFSKDGVYDGWETAVSGIALGGIAAFVEATESDREIEEDSE